MKPKQFLATAVLGLGILAFSPLGTAADKNDIEELVQLTMSKGEEGRTLSYGPQSCIQKTEKLDENTEKRVFFRVHYDEENGEKTVRLYSLLIEEWEKVKEMRGREPFVGGDQVFEGYKLRQRKVIDFACDGIVDDYTKIVLAIDSEKNIRGFEREIMGIKTPADKKEAEETNDEYVRIMLDYAKSL